MNDCKEYAVTLTATARKTVMVKAATDLEALELIEHLLACTDILDFTPEDVDGSALRRRWREPRLPLRGLRISLYHLRCLPER